MLERCAAVDCPRVVLAAGACDAAEDGAGAAELSGSGVGSGVADGAGVEDASGADDAGGAAEDAAGAADVGELLLPVPDACLLTPLCMYSSTPSRLKAEDSANSAKRASSHEFRNMFGGVE